MTSAEILKSKNFSQVAEVRPDGKNRVTLKQANAAGMYRIYKNPEGQIILDPMVVIPASEAWLFQNEVALASVRQGLAESAAGKVAKKNRKSS